MGIWEHLAAGDIESATKLAEEAYSNRLSGGEMITLCACYLWRRNWDAAYSVCLRFIDSPRWSTDSSFKLAGTAKWCAGDRVGAVALWKQGIDVDYADMGGGITIPLHLYFAAAVDPGLMPMEEAVELLHARLKAKPGVGWPYYLARLILGEIVCEDAFAQSKEDVSHLRGEAQRQALEADRRGIVFWHGVHQLYTGDAVGFQAAMIKCSTLSWQDFDTYRDLLIDLVRSTEFHLARCETTTEN